LTTEIKAYQRMLGVQRLEHSTAHLHRLSQARRVFEIPTTNATIQLIISLYSQICLTNS
jgi:hypothetical protein